MPVDTELNTVTSNLNDDDEVNDPTKPYNDTEVFRTIWEALTWKHIRTRVPICFKNSIRSRYMLANFVYLGYAIGILVIDFSPSFNGGTSSSCDNQSTDTGSILDQPVENNPYVNNLYIGFAVVHMISAFLYWWAWKDRSWLDIIMIPEYLNHIEAALYLWSSVWYSKEDTLGGYYTMAVHRIELTAALVELLASFGWIMSWYMTYTRTIGRGFTLDDPDFVAFSCTSISSVVYIVYNIQINMDPTLYGSYYLYTNGDIVYFVGSCYYIFATMRDDGWFWFMPTGGQYGVPPGRIHVETKKLPQIGKPVILMTDLCHSCTKKAEVLPPKEMNNVVTRNL